ncbi:MAG TPA: lipoyl(octanoyl) transferase LipB [Polyangiaceae bacterium]|jgi:lipoyl(octanoyl) transferase|nr:lipoyl(octanoyl) transferase LipB [Polyangiaceae bacterium]
MKQPIVARWLGRVPYEETHALQKGLLEKRIAREIPNTLLLLEHEPVVTVGRGGDGSNVIGGAEALKARGVAFAETGRGGDVTYHGPGQLVAYPIFDLRPDRCDVRKYVQDLAAVMVALCKDSGVAAGTIPGDSRYVGVWVDRESPEAWTDIDADDARFPNRSLAKIGAIGVRLSRWVTMHGFAFNVRPNLAHFGLIVPCGIREYGVTSLEDLGVHAPSIETVARRAADHFAEIFDATTITFENGVEPQLGSTRD